MNEYAAMSKQNSFVTAALVCGIAAIVSTVCMTVYLPFVLGGLSIIFATLSKTDPEVPMASRAKTGLTCGIIGLISNIALIVLCVTMIFTNPTYRKQLNDTCSEMYGITFDQMLEEIQNVGK